MMRGPICLLTSLFLVGAAPVAAQTATRRFELEDVSRFVGLRDPQIAPDGRAIVVVVSRQNLDDDRWEDELVLVDVTTQAQRVLTSGRHEVTQPRWSPTGDRLAFLAPAGEGDSARFQLFVLPMAGGEPVQVTASPTGVQQFAWRPDGSALAFSAEDEREKRAGPERHNNSFEVGNNDLFATEAPVPSHIWLVPATGGTPRRLTSGSWSLPVVPPPGPPASPLAWSPDGARIAFVHQADPHYGSADSTTVQLLDVESGAITALTGRSRFESVPVFSPDGGRVAYWYPRDGDPNNVNEIVVSPTSGGPGVVATRAIDRCLYRALWLPDGNSLLVGGNDGTRVSLWVQPLDGPARRLDLGRVSPSWSFWVDVAVGHGGAIAFTGREPQRPPELYYMASAASPVQRLTDFNGEIAGLTLAGMERVEWAGPDGYREDGVLVTPPDFDPTRRWPLALVIHGGPAAASSEVFSSLPQLLAARGYVVFQPNYRGSDNLGNAYMRAIYNDAGNGPGRDVMAGIAALKRRGFVDTTQIVVSGWSYGGYMTTWLIGHYQGWKAAVAGAAVTDLSDQYNLADFNVLERYSFTGSPWVGTNAKAYQEQSPISSAARIRTPTLILSNTGDARVPPVQSYKLFHALRDNGVTTRFIAYPASGHFPSDPVRTRDVYRRWVQWFDQQLGRPTLVDSLPAVP